MLSTARPPMSALNVITVLKRSRIVTLQAEDEIIQNLFGRDHLADLSIDVKIA